MTDDVDATIDQLMAAGADDDEIRSIISEKYGHAMGPVEQNEPDRIAVQHGPVQPGTNSALTIAGAARAVPAASWEAMRFGTSPNVPKVMGAIARGGTTTGTLLHGLATASPAEVLAASNAGWHAGKGGYFLGKGLQGIARPIAGALDAAAPAAKMLGRLAGPQSLLDLAQMAEPNRKDIGFLGIGPSVDVPGAEPPVINALIEKLRGYLRKR